MSDQLPKPKQRKKIDPTTFIPLANQVREIFEEESQTPTYTQSQLVAIIEQVIGKDEPSGIPFEHQGLGFNEPDSCLRDRNKLRREQRRRLQDLID